VSENTKWPISPDFISLRKGAFENTDDPNKDGIYYPDFIQGFLGALANDDKIKQPLAIYQLVPGDFAIDDDKIISIFDKTDEIDSYLKEIINNDEQFIRIESGELFSIKECCKIFREDEDGNTKKCFCQDSRGALFFMTNEKLKEKNDKSEFKGILEDIVNEYNIKNELPEREQIHVGELEREGEREKFVYIYYRCRYSDFDEYIFPIFYETKIIACMISSQLVPEDFNGKILLSNIYSESQKIMKKAIEDMKKTTEGLKCIPTIEQKIQKIHKQIKTLEDRIVNNLDLKKQNYINQTFAEIKNDFLKNLNAVNIKDPEKALPQIKKYAGDALEKICNQFESLNVFIRIFAIDTHTINKTFRLFIKSDQANLEVDNYEFEVNIDDFLNKHFKNEEHIQVLPLDKEKRSKLVNEFSHPKAIHNGDVFELLPTLSNNVSFIIWKRPGNWIEQKEIKHLFEDKLSDFYILIAQIYATVVDAEKEKALLDIIRIAGHEVSSVVFPMQDFVNMFEENYISYFKQEETKKRVQKDLVDLNDHISMVKNIYDKPKLAFGLINLNKRQYHHLSDILVHCAKLYRPYASDRFQIIPPPDELATHILVEVDDEHFKHIINNLLDNAVKYSYEGTKIYIRAYEEDGNLIVGVTSFGSQIAEGDRIYELYSRGENQKRSTVGLGVGMFLSKKIASAHGFRLIHNSDEMLSKYHLPALSARYFNYRNLFTSTPQSCFDEVVARRGEKDCLTLSEKTAALLINLPTYKIQFKIIIPAKSYKKTY